MHLFFGPLVLHTIVYYCTALYSTVLDTTVLHCTVLFWTLLYFCAVDKWGNGCSMINPNFM